MLIKKARDNVRDVSLAELIRKPVFLMLVVLFVWGYFVFFYWMNETGHLDYWTRAFGFFCFVAPAHFWVLIICFTCLATGGFLLLWFRYKAGSRLEWVLLSFGVGLICCTFLLIVKNIFGFNGLLITRLLSCFLLLFAVCGYSYLRQSFCPFEINTKHIGSNGLIGKICFVLVVLGLFLIWFGCLLPPSRIDSVISHLPKARNVARDGMGLWSAGAGLNAGFILSWSWGLGGGLVTSEISCALLSFCMSVFSLFVLRLWLRSFRSENCWSAVCLMLVSSPVFIGISDCAQYDPFLLFFSLLGIWYLFKWQVSRRLLHLFFCALFLSYAFGCKSLAIYSMAAAFFTLLLCYWLNQRNAKPHWWVALVFALLLFLLPIYTVHNFIRTGNPVFPYAQQFFPSWEFPLVKVNSDLLFAGSEQKIAAAIDSDFQVSWGETARFESSPISWLDGILDDGFLRGSIYRCIDFVLLPWRVSVWDSYPNGWSNGIVPSFLMLVPLLIFLRGGRLRLLAIFCLIYFIIWSFQAQHIRYGLSGLSLLAVLFGALLAQNIKSVIASIIISFLIILPCSLMIFYQVYELSTRMSPFALKYLALEGSGETRTQYLLHADGRNSYRAFIELDNINLTRIELDESLVYAKMFGEFRRYHCLVKSDWDNSNLTELFIFYNLAGGDPVRGIELLRDGGFTHVVFNEGMFDYFYLSGEIHGKSSEMKSNALLCKAFLQHMIRDSMVQVFVVEGKRIFIYELKSVDALLDIIPVHAGVIE